MDTDEQSQTSKNRVTILKLRHSHNKTKEQLEEVEKKLELLNISLGDSQLSSLKVKGTIYPNVIISFGKYKRTIDKDYDNVMIKMDNNDIKIFPY